MANFGALCNYYAITKRGDIYTSCEEVCGQGEKDV